MCFENYSYDATKGFTNHFQKDVVYESKKKKVSKSIKWELLHSFKEKIFLIEKISIIRQQPETNKQGFVADKWVQPGFLACMNERKFWFLVLFI